MGAKEGFNALGGLMAFFQVTIQDYEARIQNLQAQNQDLLKRLADGLKQDGSDPTFAEHVARNFKRDFDKAQAQKQKQPGKLDPSRREEVPLKTHRKEVTDPFGGVGEGSDSDDF